MSEKHPLEEFRRALLSISELPTLPKEVLVSLIQRGIIRRLLTDPTPESIVLLEEACAFAPLPIIREDALDALIQLSHQNNPEAILSLYRLAVERDYPPAISYLKSNLLPCLNPSSLQAVFSFLHLPENDYAQSGENLELLAEYFFHHAQPSTQTKIIQSAPSPARQRFSQLLNLLLFNTPDKPSHLLALYPQTSQAEKQIILKRLSSLAETENITAVDFLCRLAIYFDDPAAREICQQQNLSPSAPSDKAIYYFLSAQWDQYETFDFTHQWLTEAYSSASPAIRQKILSQARASGQIEWLSRLSDSRPAVVLRELTPPDWERIVQTILHNPSQLLWLRLLSHAPLYWSAYLLHHLSDHAYSFEHDPELTQAARLAAICISKPLPVFQKAILQSPASSITSMAISPFGMEIGFGSLDSSIQFLDLTSLEWQKPLLSPVSPTRLIAYDPQASYLVCAGGDHRLRIFRRHDNTLLKTLDGHKGQVRAIVFQSDGRIFYTAGFDGTIRSWHFPSGLAARPPVQIGNEIFSLLITPDNQLLLCATADLTCQIITAHGNHRIYSISGLEDVPLTLAIHNRQKFAVATRNHTIQQFSLSTFKPLTLPSPSSASINHLIYHPTLPLLCGMGLDGKIQICHDADLKPLLTIELHNQPASGLGFTPDGNTLISSSTDGQVVIWDFQPLILLFQPIQSDLHDWLQKIAQWINAGLQPASRPWLEFAQQLLLWRARFDIQIEDAEPIQIGDYDILL
jgi:WD40 repeat protein